MQLIHTLAAAARAGARAGGWRGWMGSAGAVGQQIQVGSLVVQAAFGEGSGARAVL